MSAVLAGFALWLGTTAGGAATIEQSTFDNQVKIGECRLRLNNVGVMHYKLIFKPFVAALYLGETVQPKQALADVPKRLEIEYYYALEGQDIRQAAEMLLAENVSAERARELAPKFARMNALYQSVKPGDRYALTYIPGSGTELALNGKALGKVEGADFASAYFSIWLGSKPMDTGLKSQLLRR